MEVLLSNVNWEDEDIVVNNEHLSMTGNVTQEEQKSIENFLASISIQNNNNTNNEINSTHKREDTTSYWNERNKNIIKDLEALQPYNSNIWEQQEAAVNLEFVNWQDDGDTWCWQIKDDAMST